MGDVIEHLTHPELMLDNLRALVNRVAAIVLSTPERDLTRAPDDLRAGRIADDRAEPPNYGIGDRQRPSRPRLL